VEEFGQAIVSHDNDFNNDITHVDPFTSDGKVENSRNFRGTNQHLVNVIICKNADQASDYVQVQILEVTSLVNMN
jgi:hypothetical protein